MEEEKCCAECKKDGVYRWGQGHHIVSKKQAPWMKHVPIDIVHLCIHHHEQIHKDRAMRHKYRQELQLKFILMFTKEYYTHGEIKELLECSHNSVKAITKTLPIYKEGYKREQLIFRLMGDRNYLDEVMK